MIHRSALRASGRPSTRAVIAGWLVGFAVLFGAPFDPAGEGQPPIGAAWAGDGDLRWLTVETRNFRVHYPEGLEAVAFRAARYCEDSWEIVGELFGYVPQERIEVSVSDYGDGANGSASAVPYARINLLAAPPSLSGNLGDYDDWLRILVFHEFAHIVQLDRVEGIPKWLNSVLGRSTYPNQALPSFILEGGAVWAESLTGGRGRIHSAVFRGTLRAQALAGRLHGLDVMSHFPLEWPGANVWYMYGGHFFDWVARTHGTGVAGRLHDAIADDIMPYGMNRAMREASGRTMTDLIASWQAHLTLQAEAERAALTAEGLSPLVWRTDDGQFDGNLRYHPDGTLWSLESGRVRSGIYARAPGSKPSQRGRRVFDVGAPFDLCRGGEGLIYTRVERFQGAYSRSDLYHYDFVKDIDRRVTEGARLREMTCSPDGRWAVGAQIIAGRTRLVRVELSDGTVSVLYDPERLNQVAFPAIADDGQTVVFSRVSDTTGRDLVAMDLRTGSVRTIGPTGDGAIEMNARFSHDNQWLLYASDRSGVWDIYAHRWPDGPTRRVTRVVTGARQPALSPDNQTLSMVMITAGGTDIADTPFDPEALLPLPPAVDPPTRPRAAVSDTLPSAPTPYRASEALWPVGWAPSFSFSSIEESFGTLGLEVESSDPLGHHAYTASARATPETDNIALAFNYGWRRRVATVGFGIGYETRARANGAFDGLTYEDWRERSVGTSVSVSFPFSMRGIGAGVGLSYSFRYSEPAENPERMYDPLSLAPDIPRGPDRSGSMTMSVSVGDTEVNNYDRISTEGGWTSRLGLRVRHPVLLSDYSTAEAFWNHQHYFNPWWRHVIALKLNGAVGAGDSGRRTFFGLGAPPERNWFLDALDEIWFGSTYLRGYPGGTARGDRYVLAQLEYRLPIFDLYRGVGSLPIFLERMKFAAFTDWAQATEEPLVYRPSRFLKSVGAELLTEAWVGWRRPMNVRVGYAKGLDDEGVGQWYFFVGSWF